jgi:O-antigen ligase
MIRTLTPRMPGMVTLGMLAVGVLAAIGIISLSGTKTGVALALMATIGPLGAYAAIVAPLVFPFTLFVLLVPFDNLLAMDAFGTLTRLLAIACGCSILLWLIRTRRAIMPDRSLVVWGIFAIWCLTSLVWAIDPQTSYPHLLTLFQLIALYAVASFVPIERRALRVVLVAVVLSGVIAGAYGAYLFHSGADLQVGGRLRLQNDENNVIDPNQFAAALILPISLGLVALVRARGLLVRTGAALALVIMGAGIAVSGSRGALISVTALLLWIVFRTRAYVLAGGVGLGALSVALALSNTIITRFSTASATGGAGRVDIWRVGISALHQHFWYGAGFANFPLAFDQAFLTVTERYFTHWHRAPHDLMLETAVELGIVGVAIMLTGWWLQFRSVGAIPRFDNLYGARIGVEAALIGLFISGIFLDIITTKYLWLAFVVAMLVRNAALSRVKAQQ